MTKKIVFTIIIFIGIVSNIYSQQLFRKAIFLHHSVGAHIYQHQGASTDVPTEVVTYNTTHNFTGDSAVSMYHLTEYPSQGNRFWNWWDAFRDAPGFSFKEDYLETEDYNIIIIKECFASQADIWFYWFQGPQDTINYPHTQSIYNYQWYARKIAHKMEEYPNKFFVWWDIPPIVPTGNSVEDAARLRWFNKWMVDTLATGLDTLYGAFPPNVYIYDIFELVDSANFLPLTLADGPENSHPNAACSELVAPDFVEKTFNAAIDYEQTIPVELISFSVSVTNAGVELSWATATELNNRGFEIQKKKGSSEFLPIGFVDGHGTSTNKNDYVFIDKNTNSGKTSYRLKQVDFSGNYKYSNELEIDVSTLSTYSLDQNYPNPFNPTTEISFTLANSGNITLKVYDSIGLEVATLVDGFMKSGKHSVKFNAKNFTSGVYYYRLTSDNFISTRKMILIK